MLQRPDYSLLFAIICFGNVCYISCKFIYVEVDESKRIGTTVYNLPSIDKDRFYYSLFPDYDIESLKYFKVESDGRVILIKSLEYIIGEDNTFQIVVLQRENDQIYGGEHFTLKFSVIDANNNSPVFGKSKYVGSLQENSPAGTIVSGLEDCYATDKDVSGIERYTIVKGNEKNFFAIETKDVNGIKLAVIKATSTSIDRDLIRANPILEIEIEAQDGGIGLNKKYGKTVISIKILDVNDNPPAFLHSEWKTSVPENQRVMSSVKKITATDDDEGQNSEIYYYFDDPVENFFINPATGEVTVASPLNFDDKKLFDLSVIAQDKSISNPRRAVTSLNIYIVDITNYPNQFSSDDAADSVAFKFKEEKFSVTIRGDLPMKSFIFTALGALTEQAWGKKDLKFSLYGDRTDVFSIQPKSGIILLIKALEPTVKAKFSFTLSVSDGKGNSDSVNLVINVQPLNLNQHYPAFSKSTVSIRVSEDRSPQSSIYKVSASDSDEGDNGKVSYTIVGGSGIGIFSVSKSSGVVSNKIKFKSPRIYDLLIKAEDNGYYKLSSHMYLRIVIFQSSKLAPLLSKAMYEGSIYDSIPENSFITAIFAKSASQSASVTYEIKGNQRGFYLNPSTGVLATNFGIEYDDSSEIDIEVLVRMEGFPQESKTLVKVHLVYLNKQKPRFLRETVQVYVEENSGYIPNLACLIAVDGDMKFGKSNLKYMIEDGNSANNLFHIDQQTGKLSVGNLDYEKKSKYKLKISASDGLHKAQSTVDVFVVDGKEIPHFDGPISVEINEGNKANTLVAEAKVVGSSTNSHLCQWNYRNHPSLLDMFTLKTGRSSCSLFIKSGAQVKWKKTHSAFMVIIDVVNKNSPSESSSTIITVRIKDTKNDPPKFLQSSYAVTLKKGVLPETKVLSVMAHDYDEGMNGNVIYSIKDGLFSNLFKVTANGDILTKSSLTKDEYKLTVIASDRALSSSVDIFVTLIDGDIPKFIGSMEKKLPENHRLDIFDDIQTNEKKSMIFELVGGNNENFFTISRRGKLQLMKNLDYEKQKHFNLMIRATSDTNKPKIYVESLYSIIVEDINDNTPFFPFLTSSEPVHVNVIRNSPKETILYKLKSYDKDSGDNGQVSLSIVQSWLPFQIDDNGIITVKNAISESIGEELNFDVRATDNGDNSKYAEQSFIAKVIDGKPPSAEFKSSLYTASLGDNVEVGKSVVTLDNSGITKNAPVLFEITNGNNNDTFCIDSNRIVYVQRYHDLDVSHINTQLLYIEMKIGKQSMKSSVKLSYTDINDNSPMFKHESPVEVKVSENTKAGSVIYKVEAVDPDSGDNGKIIYSIERIADKHAFERDLFEIDGFSGDLSIREKLDYEQASFHKIIVKASDSSSSNKRYALQIVKIIVLDENDEAPEFIESEYNADISSIAKPGEQILTVYASDFDSGKFGQVTYRLIGETYDGSFSIGETKGTITIRKPIALRDEKTFQLFVQASDMKSTAQTKVVLKARTEEGPPKFALSRFAFSVKEDVKVLTKLGTLKAISLDVLKYTITDGNKDDKFQLDPSTGNLLVKRPLDAEKKTAYILDVRTTDLSERFAEARVEVNVLNVNDNDPMFKKSVDGLIEGIIDREAIVGRTVIDVGAFDEDINDKLTLRITTYDAMKYFQIDSKGVIRTGKSLRDLAPDENVYEFEVTATDSGSKQVKATVRLVLSNIQSGTTEVDVSEDRSIGDEPFINEQNSFGKQFPDGSFRIVFPKNNPFAIDVETGFIKLKETLDYEKVKSYDIIVEEINKETPSEYINYKVKVNVIDVNDNSPKFAMTNFISKVNKNAMPGTKVLKLLAKDPDSGFAGRVIFEIKTEDVPFSVDQARSELTVSRSNLLKENWYNISIVAFDQGRPPKSSPPITVYISTGENPPQFERQTYQFNIEENAVVGSLIGKIKAKSFSGFSITYTIQGDDLKKTFDINDEGQVILQDLLDYESGTNLYTFTVQAIEENSEPLASTCTVTVTVDNVNDHKPQFTSDKYQKENVLEDVKVGTTLLRVSATDCDCDKCECSGGSLFYSISEYTDVFEIDPVTGDIRTIRELDYDTKNVYDFKVKVKDTGEKPYENFANVVIMLEDINDVAPVFNPVSYVVVVTENRPAGYYFYTARAKDIDSVGGPVTYSIKEGASNLFEIEEKSGVVKLSNLQKPVFEKETYLLKIVASDGVNEGVLMLTVNIEDVNDNKPVFPDCTTYKASVQEQSPIGTSVIQVVATDEDRGRNGEIEYEIIDRNRKTLSEPSFFKINNKTGLITTNRIFDREKKRSHIVLVMAYDGGHGTLSAQRQSASCQLDIQIDDINDNKPVFDVQNADFSIGANTEINSVILVVSAIDDDEGSNAKVKYSIENDVQSNSAFVIGESTGAISVVKSLVDGPTNYNLRVKASDSAPVPLSSTLDVSINVQRANPPRFSKRSYYVQIREDTKVGVEVFKVLALSQAKGNDKSVRYFFLEGTMPSTNKPQTFTIEPLSGRIILAKHLDYEQLKEYTLTVVAIDNDNLKSNVKIFIAVQDVNDNLPIFDMIFYNTGNVAEGEQPGQVVTTVSATDLDTGLAGQVRYYLDEESSGSKYFSIDDITGEIRTKATFDREKTPKIDFNVIAKDQGEEHFSSQVSVSVIITDVNDNPPKFLKTRYNIEIDEDISVNSDVIEIKAEDADVGENSKLSYFILSGNNLGFFGTRTINQLDGTSIGFITVEKSLDREKQSEFKLEIVARDLQFNANTTVFIKVNDVNDNDPVFDSPKYDVNLPENSGEGKIILTVKAKDIDSSAVQKRLIYSLAKEATGYFIIDSSTGVIRTGTKTFNREEKSVFTFLVFASDGDRTGSSTIKVKILDENDEKPQFLDGPYVRHVLEGKKSGAEVGYVTATDRDFGDNAMITYSIQDDSGKFSIDANTGLIRTKAILDREKELNRYMIKVVATDQGKVKLSDVTDVTILVDDANDNNPEFVQKKLSVDVFECVKVGKSILQIQATDKDEGNNAKLIYEITAGNTPRRFRIDPLTGHLMVSVFLDYEEKKNFQLKIGVRDSGIYPQLRSPKNAVVDVNVKDCNDNSPVFEKSNYFVSVLEDKPVGTQIIKVSATDKDTGDFGKFTFGIVEPTKNYHFKIESKGDVGIISLAWKLDRETTKKHIFKVYARDISGNKQLTGYSQVTVTVLDVNDNGPTFKTPDFCGFVREQYAEVQEVAVIEVSDLDAKGGCPCTFRIVEDPSNLFVIESMANGNLAQIKTKFKKQFDRESPGQQLYKLKISATDNGKPPKTSYTYVYIEVGDENDNLPKSGGKQEILINSYMNKFQGMLGNVYIIDDDKKLASIYSHKIAVDENWSSKFSIDRNGGIRINSPLSAGKYSFRVESRTTRGEQMTIDSSVDINVRQISKELIQNAIPMRMSSLTKTNTCKDLKYPDYEQVLADALNVRKEQIIIFSYIPVPNIYRGVDLWFTVLKDSNQVIIQDQGKYMDVEDIMLLLNANKNSIERKLGGRILSIGIDACAKETCAAGFCYNTPQATSQTFIATSGAGEVPALESSKTFVSLVVFMKAVCLPKPRDPETCLPINPCKNDGVCFAIKPSGYRCSCKDGFDGPRCEQTTIHIREGGYMWLKPLTVFFEGKISFEFRTVQDSGLLFFQGPISKPSDLEVKDFIAVDLIRGNLRLSVNMGGEKFFQRVLFLNAPLSDDVFHHVVVVKQGKAIKLILDHCKTASFIDGNEESIDRSSCEISGIVPGKWKFINGDYPVQLGHWVHAITDQPNNYPTDFQPFEGCIRRVSDNNMMYDLSKPIKEKDTEKVCPDAANLCPPCTHGSCHATSAPFKCTCFFGWQGDLCDQRSTSWRFLDNSYTRFTLLDMKGNPKVLSKVERRTTSYKLQLKTQADGLILFEGNSGKLSSDSDFSLLEIKDGFLQYRYNLGDGRQTIRVQDINVTDNSWYNVTVLRQSTLVTVEVMRDGHVVAYVMRNQGFRPLLDTDGTIYVGGIPMNDGSGPGGDDGTGGNDGGEDPQSDAPVLNDLQGCIASLQYKDTMLDDAGPSYVNTNRQNVDENCTCSQADAALCLNGATCVAASPPMCLCGSGYGGPTCADAIVGGRASNDAVPPTPGILMVMVLVLSIFLIVVACLALFASGIFKKKSDQIPIYVDTDGYGNIMPYNDEGAAEEDFQNYDMEKLLQHVGGKGLTFSGKYAHIMTNGVPGVTAKTITVTKKFQVGDDGTLDEKEALIQENLLETDAPFGAGGPEYDAMGNLILGDALGDGEGEGKVDGNDDAEDVDVKAFIEGRIADANTDDSLLPRDTLLHYGYEGDGSDVSDLSELNESDDEGSGDEGDYSYMMRFGPKFDNLNSIYNPQYEDSDNDV